MKSKRFEIVTNKIQKGIKLNKNDLIYLYRLMESNPTVKSQIEKNKSLFNKVISIESDIKKLNDRLEKTTTKRKYYAIKKYGTNHHHKTTNKNIDEIEYLIEPINDGYLFYLIESINCNIVNQNDYLISLFNLLTDRNYLINSIGLKINIVKFLKDIDLKELQILKVKNSYLSDKYSYLSFKNDKNKQNRNKLIFTNEMIIINSLDSDRIYSIVIYQNGNESVNDIMNTYINDNIKSNDIKSVNIKNNQYTMVDKESKTYNFICDLINILKLFDNQYNDLNINPSDLNEYNLFEYIQILNENFLIFQRYDKLNFKFEYINKYLMDLDLFQSNDLDLTHNKPIVIENFNDINSYDSFKYSNKELKLFDIPYKKESIKSKHNKINKLLDL